MQKGMLCVKCDEIFNYKSKDCYWHENGNGYSTKLIRCPLCGQLNIIKYKKDRHFQISINVDELYYVY